MAEYLPGDLKIKARFGNVVVTDDANVWCLYQIDGVHVDLYSEDSVHGARKSHARMFDALLDLDTDEIRICGFRSRLPLDERLNKIVKNVPSFSDKKYPELQETLRYYSASVESGVTESYRRIYVVACRVPLQMSFMKKFLASMFDQDFLRGESEHQEAIRDFNRRMGKAIPREFNPMPAKPDILEWLRERHATRGVIEPYPYVPTSSNVVPANAAFPNIRLNPAPDAEATVSSVVDRLERRGIKADAKSAEGLFKYFRSLQKGRVLAVHNYDRRLPELPDGAISYQAVAAVGKYSTVPDFSLKTLTSIVDQANDLDGDFTITIQSEPELADNRELNKEMDKVERENEANTTSNMDFQEYVSRAWEIQGFAQERENEENPRPLSVTTVFAFGAARLDVLHEKMLSLEHKMRDDGYALFRPIGSQVELWESMLPCVASTKLIDELKGTTTAELLGAYAPFRRITIGDGVGLPLGACIETTLGSEVHLDLVEATARGNGSIAFTGAQGRGKSYAMKRVVSALSDLKYFSVILDMQGEWATYAQQLPSHQVVDLASPQVSIDPLKMLDDRHLDFACSMLHQLLLPMFGVKPKTAAEAALTAKISPSYIRARESISTTRDLLEHLVSNAAMSVDYQDAVPIIRSMLNDPTMAAIVDPVVNGRVQVLPPMPVEARTIVFVTAGLSLPSPDTRPEEWNAAQSYAIMANTAVAVLSQHLFRQLSGKTSSAFVADEVWALQDLAVLQRLIKEPDRTGRKFGSFVVVGSQTGEELSRPEYKLIRRRVVLGQDNAANAEEALRWAGFADSSGEVPQQIVSDLVSNTSPLDPSNENRAIPGRAGEAYYNDGTTKAKIKLYPEMRPQRARFADTNAQTWVRYDREKGDVPQ